MKNIRIVYAILFVGLTALWLLADNILSGPHSFFPVRASLVNFTGVLAMGAMSVGMVLALRPFHVEPFLGGMDKSYRLHKWLGVTALVVSIVHWAWAVVPKWLVGWGLLTKPQRGRGGADHSALVELMQSQRGFAELVGEWAFYAAVVLILIALIKLFPYRLFFNTHRLLALVYLVLVYHSVILMKLGYWNAAIGLVMAALMVAGSIAAVISLMGGIGRNKKAIGYVDSLEYHRDNRVLEVIVQLRDRWESHKAGQFAFVTFDNHEGAHPFTMSSSWNHLGTLRFHIKALGDYTSELPKLLKAGEVVTVEGPYGCFDFASRQDRQIWVGGGIGITPFIARLQALTVQKDGREIDLFYSTAEPDQEFIKRLEQLAQQAGVRLHLIISGRNERLTPDRLRELVPQWRDASVWFCGPAGFGHALREGLVAQGFDVENFHQELFDMR